MLPKHATVIRNLDLQGALNATVSVSLRPVVAGLTLLYLTFAVSHLFVLPARIAPGMSALAFASALLFAASYLVLGRYRVPHRWAHPAAATVSGVILLNSLVHLALTADPQQTSNVLLLIVGVSSLVLSWRWLALIALGSVVAWGAVGLAVGLGGWSHYGFALFAATLLAFVIHTVRHRAFWRLEHLNLEQAAQQEALELAVVAAQQSEERFRRLSEASFEGVLLFDRGRILDASAKLAHMLGYALPELIGLSVATLTAPASPNTFEGPGWGDTPFEVHCLRKDGLSLPAEVALKTLPYRGRTVRVAAVRDMRAWRAAQARLLAYGHELEHKNAELARADRLKSEFLATVSHELRTPLTAILGFSELLRDELFGPLNDKQRQYAGDIHEAGKRLLGLIDDLLDLSRMEGNRTSLTLTAVDLGALLTRALAAASLKAQAGGVILEPLPTTPLPSLEADEEKLEQVVQHYLSNAIKFTPAGGRVRVSVHGSSSDICVSVSDTGIGVAAADLDKLFKPFSQVDSSYARHFEGTGLGLALSKRLIELHGGTVWVESSPTEGSTFGFSVPRQQVRATPAGSVGEGESLRL